MPEHYDVIVIGLGAMGSSAAMHLARRGARVLGLERFSIPHEFGSSHGHSRMIRLCYYEHPDYVPLLRRAYELWTELERLSGLPPSSLLTITGGLYIGAPEGEMVRGSHRAAVEHNLPHQMLAPADLRARFPQFRLPPKHVALFEPAAGFLRPEAVITAQAHAALRLGADLRSSEPVLEWSADAGGAWVRTERAEHRADRLIFTSGAWTHTLVRDLGVPLVVTRQIVGWVRPRHPDLFRLGAFPCWAIGREDDSLYYGFPMIPDNPGLKVALHARGAAADPDRLDRTVAPHEEEEFRRALRDHLPDADGPTLSSGVCMYTNSPDSHFILDRHPAHARVTIAAGFSGHGFKFASVVGEALSDLALDGSTRLPIGFLSLARFRKSM